MAVVKGIKKSSPLRARIVNLKSNAMKDTMLCVGRISRWAIYRNQSDVSSKCPSLGAKNIVNLKSNNDTFGAQQIMMVTVIVMAV